MRHAKVQPAAAAGQIDSAFPTVSLVLSIILEIVLTTSLRVADSSSSARRDLASRSIVASRSCVLRLPIIIATLFTGAKENLV